MIVDAWDEGEQSVQSALMALFESLTRLCVLVMSRPGHMPNGWCYDVVLQPGKNDIEKLIVQRLDKVDHMKRLFTIENRPS